MQKRPSPLKKLFAKQQPKVKATVNTGNLLKTFAEDDYKRIAKLIRKWLDEDAGKVQKK